VRAAPTVLGSNTTTRARSSVCLLVHGTQVLVRIRTHLTWFMRLLAAEATPNGFTFDALRVGTIQDTCRAHVCQIHTSERTCVCACALSLFELPPRTTAGASNTPRKVLHEVATSLGDTTIVLGEELLVV